MRVAAALLKANQEENEELKKAQRRWTHIKPDFATRGIYGVVFHRGPIDGRHIQQNVALRFNSHFSRKIVIASHYRNRQRAGGINHHSTIFNEWSVTKSKCKSLTCKGLLESWNELGLSTLSPQCCILHVLAILAVYLSIDWKCWGFEWQIVGQLYRLSTVTPRKTENTQVCPYITYRYST